MDGFTINQFLAMKMKNEMNENEKQTKIFQCRIIGVLRNMVAHGVKIKQCQKFFISTVTMK